MPYDQIWGHKPIAQQFSQQDQDQAGNLGQSWGVGGAARAQSGDYGQANNSLALAAQYAGMGNHTGYQDSALAQTYGLASGRIPSAAALQQQQQLNAGMAAQQAAAGSAMGGSLGQLAAMRSNAQASPAMYQQGMQQVAATQAQAQQQAQMQYAQQVSQARQSDLAGMGSYQAQAQQQAQNATQQAQFAQGQNQLSDQAQLYGQDLQRQMATTNYNEAQQFANMNQAAYQANQRHRSDAKNSAWQRGAAAVGSAATTLAKFFTSDERAKVPVSLGEVAHMGMWR